MRRVVVLSALAAGIMWMVVDERSANALPVAAACRGDDVLCTSDDGPAEHLITVSPTSITPAYLEVDADDLITFYNASTDSVTLEIDSPVSDPFGPDVGSEVTISAQGQVHAIVQRRAKGRKVRVTVKGSTSTTSTIDVRSG